MRTVSDLLKEKGSEIWSTTPESAVYSALLVMAEKNVGALAVVQEGRLAGIFSERDYARRAALQENTSRDTPVAEFMTPDPLTVGPGQTVGECMALMTAKRIRHLPVLVEGRLVGMISIGDVVKDVIRDQADTIYWLEHYITGGR